VILVRSRWLRRVTALIETLNLLGVKLFFANRAQFTLYPGIVFRNYTALLKRGSWNSATLFELFPESAGQRITVEHLRGEGIATPIEELAALAYIARAMAPKNIFEIGTFRGRTALNFALNTSDECRIHTMDLSEHERRELEGMSAADKSIVGQSLTGIDYKNKGVDAKIVQLLGNSLTFDFAPYYGKMDIVLVDGAHHYEAVVSDTKHALKMVAPKGVILWHDWGNYGDYNDVMRGVLTQVERTKIYQVENTQFAIYRS
jgi:predicted O-methyltransferase YrrM